ncbi:hypothetical protein BDP67DRAFT_75011 [Colletotrichum lupini]|nr:hypothetical protein BDP67DRAFT_75011 [Colletotrichum lupini]
MTSQVAFSHLIPKLQFEQKRRITSTRRLGVCGVSPGFFFCQLTVQIYPSSIGWLAMYGLILNYIPTASVTAPHHTEECNPSRSRVTNVHRRGGTWKLHAARTSAMLRLRCACERKYNRSQTFCHRLTGFPSSCPADYWPRSNVAVFHHARTRQLNCSTSHRPHPLDPPKCLSKRRFSGPNCLLLHGAQTLLMKHWGRGI